MGHRVAVILRQLLRKLVAHPGEFTVVRAVAQHYAVVFRHRDSIGGFRAIKERILEFAVVRVVFLPCDEPQ